LRLSVKVLYFVSEVLTIYFEVIFKTSLMEDSTWGAIKNLKIRKTKSKNLEISKLGIKKLNKYIIRNYMSPRPREKLLDSLVNHISIYILRYDMK
jgi:hypothetical protein